MTHLIEILARFLCTVYIIITIGTSMSYADPDWMQDCGPCKCKWSSGRKYGDCKNSSLKRVPLGLSTELQVLDLSANNINEIHKQEFSTAKLENLHKLFIRNCSLREIHRDGLKNLKILIEIDLSNNLMKILHPGVFTGLIKLRSVILNNNLLERLDDRLFDNLEFLHKIELKENRIHKISLNTFFNVSTLSQIYLDSNHLKTLRRESFHSIEKLTSLSLAENMWNCTCDLRPFRDYTIEKNLYTPPTNCYDPPSLRGKYWTDIPSDYFACRPKILVPLAGAFMDAFTENVTLTCRIKGSPTPEVTWFYNKQIINDYERRFHLKKTVEKITRNTIETITSELTIIGVKSNDRGTYTCVAKNYGGRDQADIMLAISPETKSGAKFTYLQIVIMVCLVTSGVLVVLVIGMAVRVTKRRCKKNNCDGALKPNYDDKNIDRGGNEFESGVGCGTVGGIGGGGGGGGGAGCTSNKSVPVIKEIQKNTASMQEVNLIEKPLRRAYIELNGNAVIERPCDNNKMSETNFGESF